GFQIPYRGARLALTEEPLVRYVTDNGEPPGIRLEAIAIGGGNHQRQRIRIQLREGGVAVPRLQPERIDGEVTGGEYQLQLVANGGRGSAVADQRRNRLPAAQDLRLLVPRPRHVQWRTGGGGESRQEDHHPAAPRRHAQATAEGGHRAARAVEESTE